MYLCEGGILLIFFADAKVKLGDKAIRKHCAKHFSRRCQNET